MTQTRAHPEPNHQYLLGMVENSSLRQTLSEALPRARILPFPETQIPSGLDAIIVTLQDAHKLPHVYEAPVILVGKESDQSMLPLYTVSAIVPAEQSLSMYPDMDLDALIRTIEHQARATKFTRITRELFPELQVTWDTIQEKLIASGGNARSFFEAYQQLCTEHIDRFTNEVKRTADPAGIRRLYKLMVRAGNEQGLDDLIKTHESIAIVSNALRLLEDPQIGEFTELVMRGLALAAPILKDTPYLMDVEKNTHFTLMIPAKPPAYLKLALDNPQGLRNEVGIIKLFREFLDVKYFKDRFGDNYLSIPQLRFVPSQRFSERLEKLNFYCFAEYELPGTRAIDAIYNLEQRLRKLDEKKLGIIEALDDIQHGASPDVIAQYQQELEDMNSKTKALREEDRSIKDTIIENTARASALGYILSKMDAGQPLVQPAICRTADEYLNYLELGFFGDEDAVVKGRQARGIKLAEKQLDNANVLREVNTYLAQIREDITPIIDLMVESPSGIDLDRSIINMLIEARAKENVVHHAINDLDFELFRSDPVLHGFAKTLLLLRRYGNDTIIPAEDIRSVRNPESVLISQGKEVHHYQLDLARFVNLFSTHFEALKETFAKKNPGMRIRWPLPDPGQLEDHFHAFSAFRGMLYFGYFERCKELQPQRKPIFNHYQDLALENAMHSIDVLAGKHAGTIKGERLRRVQSTLEELHDKYIAWRAV